MNRFLSIFRYRRAFRYYGVVSISLLVFAALLTAAYINLLTSSLNMATLSFAAIGAALKGLAWWNAILSPIVILSFLQYRIADVSNKRIEERKCEIIQNIMEITAKSLVYPKSTDERHIRAIVTLYRSRDAKRVTCFHYNTKADPERVAVFPFDFGVTGEAFVGRQVVIRELTDADRAAYSPEIRSIILGDLKTVIAAPILDFDREEGLPLGVLAFDSSLRVSEHGLQGNEIRNIVQGCADSIGLILYAAPEVVR